MTGISITADEKRWRAENDARTLAEANVIKKDPSRLQAAADAAQRMVEEQQKEAAAMRSVARSKTKQNSTSQTQKQKRTSAAKSNTNFNVFQRLS